MSPPCVGTIYNTIKNKRSQPQSKSPGNRSPEVRVQLPKRSTKQLQEQINEELATAMTAANERERVRRIIA